MKKYTIIYISETDGEMQAAYESVDGIREIISRCQLCSSDYFIVDGPVLPLAQQVALTK